MVKYHLKRLAAPKTWSIMRKTGKFIVKPFPSGIGLKYSMPVSVWLIEMLNLAKDGREVFYLLKEKKVLVNQHEVYSKKYPVGLFDVISLPETGKHYRIVLNKRGKLTAVEISESEANLKVLKLINKTLVKGGEVQFNFNDGTNLLAIKELSSAKPQDSILYDLKNKKVLKHLPLNEGALVYVLSGSHVANLANVAEKRKKDSKITIKLSDSTLIEVPFKNLIVIGTGDKPEITTRGDNNAN